MNKKIMFLTEIPTAHLDELHPLVDGHFCIASECLKDQAYFEWFCNRPKDAYVMLDNGMFEEGKPLDPNVLFNVAEAIKPNVVFAPDVVGKKDKTLGLTRDFFDLCARKKAKWDLGVIPQGCNPHQIVACHNEMLKEFDITGPIGISFLNNRDEVIRIMNKQDAWSGFQWYHFLGLYNLAEIKSWPNVVHSMDTIKPFKAAHYGHQLEDCPRGLGKWNTRLELAPEGKELLYRNYARMHAALRR